MKKMLYLYFRKVIRMQDGGIIEFNAKMMSFGNSRGDLRATGNSQIHQAEEKKHVRFVYAFVYTVIREGKSFAKGFSIITASIAA